jgi:hypothetical protein
VETWVEILKEVPYIAMILALGVATVLLYKSREKDRLDREKLQAEYRENLVQATSALNDLASEQLKQAFADSAAWQDRVKGLEDTFKAHMQDDLAADGRIEAKLASVLEEFERHEGRMREFVKDHVGQVADRSMEQFERAMRAHRN